MIFVAGEPESCARQRLRRGQPGEKAAAARHVRPARSAHVQHRPVAVPDGVQIGRGPAVRRRSAVRVGRRGHGKVEAEEKDQRRREEGRRRGDVDHRRGRGAGVRSTGAGAVVVGARRGP